MAFSDMIIRGSSKVFCGVLKIRIEDGNDRNNLRPLEML